MRPIFLVSLACVVAAQKIDWTIPCSKLVRSLDSTVPLVCGRLDVPLDYTGGNSSQTLSLELTKISASNGSNSTSSKPSILFNFGGPGSNGLDAFINNVSTWQVLTGGDRDLILPNPRGVGDTLPFVCSEGDVENLLDNQWVTFDGNASDVALGQAWGTTKLFANRCKSSPNATAVGELIGSTFVARDYMRVVDALHEDGLIHFWGFSYGTVLGDAIAALFPDRIGSLINDGNGNPLTYFNGVADSQRYVSADKAFSTFCAGCVATPTLCPLARNQTADELEQTLYDFFDHIKFNPIPVSYPNGTGGLLDYTTLKMEVYDAMALPIEYPAISRLLSELLRGDTSHVNKYFFEPGNVDLGNGIACSDNNFRTSNRSDMELAKAINFSLASSRLAGGFLTTDLICAQWPFHAKENFTFPSGNGSIRTKNPALFISNTADPKTPMLGGETASAILNGSVLLQHDGVGHTALQSQGSLCTARAIRAYWVNGTLPQPRTICNIDFPVFATDNGWNKVIKELADDMGL